MSAFALMKEAVEAIYEGDNERAFRLMDEAGVPRFELAQLRIVADRRGDRDAYDEGYRKGHEIGLQRGIRQGHREAAAEAAA